MKERDLWNNFTALNSFLCGFNSDVCGSNVRDKVVIANFVSEYKAPELQQTIAEGRKLLAFPIEDFPHEWIVSFTCNSPTLIEGDVEHILEGTKENYYNWFKQVIDELENEAKRQGKL